MHLHGGTRRKYILTNYFYVFVRYKNWSIKVYLVSSCGSLGLSVVGLSVTLYQAIVNEYLRGAYTLYHAYYATDALHQTLNATAIKDVFFE